MPPSSTQATTTGSGSRQRSIGLGLVGCGSFGRFCLRAFQKLPGVHPVAVTGILPAPAQETGREFALPVCADMYELAGREDIDVIHIATPPSTHADLAIIALKAGKNVLCEKPLATTLEEARLMVDVARASGCFLAVNLIMRYNPLNQAVAKILQSGLLGAPIHASFENNAGDTLLGPQHWFWNKTVSGGIFVEHGVHFFDLFRMWFGKGRVVAAQQLERPGSLVAPNTHGVIDQVHCTLQYPNALLGSFYHGFHQPNRAEYQETRIVCERGTIRLLEWVSTQIEIDFLGTQSELKTLCSLVPNSRVETLAHYQGSSRDLLGRNKNLQADGRFRISGNTGMSKPELYEKVLCLLLEDQIKSIADPNHPRLVTEENGLESLQTALAAEQLARS